MRRSRVVLAAAGALLVLGGGAAVGVTGAAGPVDPSSVIHGCSASPGHLETSVPVHSDAGPLVGWVITGGESSARVVVRALCAK
jgi:hypothetical protein